jgi:hypothetical protein
MSAVVVKRAVLKVLFSSLMPARYFRVIWTMATMIRTIRPIPMIQPKIHIGHMPHRIGICAITVNISTSCSATLRSRKSLRAVVLFESSSH